LVGCSNHLLPMALLVLFPPTAVSLRQGRVIGTVSTIEVAGGLGFPAEVGLDASSPVAY
jgi:hypothetical protein